MDASTVPLPAQAGPEFRKDPAESPPAEAFHYDAFVSYSHAVDHALAPALQAALRRFARPYPRRARNVFLDETGLRVTEALWPTIRAALESSRAFVLLASPDAVQSEWVNREVLAWLEQERHLPLIVVTAGGIHWHGDQFDPEHSTAVPPPLLRAYGHEPKWVDLRWASKDQHLRRSDPRFVQAVAQLAAALDETPLEDLLDLDGWYRRLWVRLGIATLMLIGFLTAIAWWQAAEAQRQGRAATRTAIVRTAATLMESDPTRAALVLTSLERTTEPPGAAEIAARIAALPISTVYRGHRAPVVDVAFHPHDPLFATASQDGTAIIWSTRDSRTRVDFTGHRGFVDGVRWSPSGDRLLTWDDRTARVWRADGMGDPVILSGHTHFVTAAAFSPDAKSVVTGGYDNLVNVFDAAGVRKRLPLQGHTSPITGVQFSPDNRQVLTASGDGTAKIWSIRHRRVVRVFRHRKGLNGATYSPKADRVLTFGADGIARVWSVRNARPLVTLRGHTEAIRTASFDRDGSRVLTASYDGTARIWPAVPGGSPVVLRGHTAAIYDARFDPTGRFVVTASADRSARVWRADGQGLPIVLRGHDDAVIAAAFSADSKVVVTTCRDGTIREWLAQGSLEPIVFRGHTGPVNAARFSPDGRHVATAGNDNTARIWPVEAPEKPRILSGHELSVLDVSYSPDGSKVVTSATDGTARVWSVSDAAEPVILDHAGETKDPFYWAVWTAWFNRGGDRITTSGNNGAIRSWRLDGTHIEDFRIESPDIQRAIPSPDGALLLTLHRDSIIRVWQPAKQGPPVELKGHEGTVMSASFSRDATRVVGSGADRTARIWRVDGGGETVVLRGHLDAVEEAAFSPDGVLVVTTSADHAIRIWRPPTPDPVLTLESHRAAVSSVAFSPDGSRILTAGADGTARLWRFKWDELFDYLTSTTRTCLTDSERRRYLAESPDRASEMAHACEQQLRR